MSVRKNATLALAIAVAMCRHGSNAQHLMSTASKGKAIMVDMSGYITVNLTPRQNGIDVSYTPHDSLKAYPAEDTKRLLATARTLFNLAFQDVAKEMLGISEIGS